MKKKHSVRSYYDQYSEDYDKFYYEIQRDKFVHLSPYLDKSPYVIDFGGGSGLITTWVEEPVINFDISIEMLKNGLSKRSYQPIAADLEHLPIRSTSLSNVISLTAYQNTENLLESLFELRRVLKINQHAIVSFLKKTTSKTQLENYFSQSKLAYRYIAYSGEDYCYLLSSLVQHNDKKM